MEITAKARQTREHILSTALALFERKGYQETTLRDIAGEAKVSLGLTYRYFASKEDLVLAIYERLSKASAGEAAQLPRGSVAVRFGATLNSCLDSLVPYRSALGSLFAAGLSGTSEMAVLGDRAAGIRHAMWSLYREAVSGATDAPKERQIDQLTTLLYAGHLLTMLFWIQDPSEGQQRTRSLIRFSEGLLKKLKPVMGLPIVSGAIGDLDKILGPMFGPGRA